MELDVHDFNRNKIHQSILYYPYHQPFNFLGIQDGHPQWIGAWWMGLVIISIILILVSPLMTLFPSKLPTRPGSKTDADVSHEFHSL